MPEGGQISDAQRRSIVHPSFDSAIAQLACRQHGVFTLDELRDLGLSRRGVQRRASSGRLHRVYLGVYSLVPPTLRKREGWWMAAVLAARPGAVLSHRDAAALHQLLQNNRTRIEVTVPGRSPRPRRGLDVHRSLTLTETDIAVVDRRSVTPQPNPTGRGQGKNPARGALHRVDPDGERA